MIDKEMADQIGAEYEAMFGQELETKAEELAPEPPPEPVVVPEIESPWAQTIMFSEVFDAEDWLSSQELRDLPLPLYAADDWAAEAQPLIPTLPSHWHFNLHVMYNMCLSLLGRDTTLLVGPTGTGKTASIMALAATLHIPVWHTSMYEGMEDTVLLGSTGLATDPETGNNVTQYNPSQLVNSLRYGGIALLDEVWRSQCVMAIQPLLEDKHTLVLADADGIDEADRVLVAPDDWFLFMTDNTTGTGDHTGNYNAVVQDLSSLDRVTNTLHVDYNEPEVEMDILRRAVTGLPRAVASDMVQVAGEVRAAFLRGALLQTMSMRALISWARKWATTGSVEMAYRLAFHNKLDPEGQQVSGEVYYQVFAAELSS